MKDLLNDLPLGVRCFLKSEWGRTSIEVALWLPIVIVAAVFTVGPIL